MKRKKLAEATQLPIFEGVDEPQMSHQDVGGLFARR